MNMSLLDAIRYTLCAILYSVPFTIPSFLCYTNDVEKPKMRWIEAHPVMHEGREAVLIRDGEGITENPLIVSKDVVYLLSLMDGTRSLRDIQVEYMRAFGELIYIERIQELVETLNVNLFLLNDHYKNYYEKLKEEYEQAHIRKPYLSGKSYPENKDELLVFLDEMFQATAHGESKGDITGILAPHIDYARGKEVYRDTYPYIKHIDKPLLIIFGTSHQPTDKIWNISLKDFSTPLGIIHNSKELGRLIRNNPVLKEYIAEWPHRNEHSIELQLPVIQFLAAGKNIEILPILTGSMHDYMTGQKHMEDEEIMSITESFQELLNVYGKPYIVISGADLAHIGVQFGDIHPLDFFTLNQSQDKDEAILNRIRNVDASGFFNTIQDEKDVRRICGLTPIYFQLNLLSGSQCEVVSYKQWTDGKSSVSFAGGIFYQESAKPGKQ